MRSVSGLTGFIEAVNSVGGSTMCRTTAIVISAAVGGMFEAIVIVKTIDIDHHHEQPDRNQPYQATG